MTDNLAPIMPSSPPPLYFWQREGGLLVALLAMGFIMTIVVYKAFLAEDAFIVFRSVENFLRDLYFSAIADVRSQSYTSNLWTLLLMAGRLFWPDIRLVASLLSLSCIFLALTTILLQGAARRQLLAAAAVVFLLGLSHSFTDYATGGLENPLACLLLTLLVAEATRADATKIHLPYLGFLAATLIFNRYDHALFALPLVLATLRQRGRWRHDLLPLALGGMVLPLWMGFAWFYYGNIFPDTYFAKMEMGVALGERLHIPLLHQLRMLDHDPVGMLVTLLALLGYPFWRKGFARVQAEGKSPYDGLWLGLLLYNVYFFYCGGDFMLGRFMTLVILSAALLVGTWFTHSVAPPRPHACVMLAFALLLALSYKMADIQWIVPRHSPDTPAFRASTWDYRSFLQAWRFIGLQHGKQDWQEMGQKFNREADLQPYPLVWTSVSAGIIPFYAGSRFYMIDELGLSDPLLSRLPCYSYAMAAHCGRKVPKGYELFVKNGDTTAMEPELVEYARPLFAIKTMPLWSIDRLSYLLKMTLGRYDEARKKYVQKTPELYYKAGGSNYLRCTEGYQQTILRPFFKECDSGGSAIDKVIVP